MNKKIVIIGSGVAGINAAKKLVDNGYPGELITIIDKGKDPYERPPSEVMEGFAGAGGFSDGKLTYHTAIGGQLSKYCGEEKAMELFDQTIDNWKQFHPNPSQIMYSNPQAEPEFIKPEFGLRLFPVYHIGTDYLHQIGKSWYQYLVDKGITFYWKSEVVSIDFNYHIVYSKYEDDEFIVKYDTLIFGAGKSGIDFSNGLIKNYKLQTEPKSVQIGVRFEAPQKYFQKIIDISYDFKLYQKPNDNVSLRTFCTNNNAAYVAVEETYGDITYNGHAKKGEQYRNDMTNFGIIMELKGIDNPFEWSRKAVQLCQGKKWVSKTDNNYNQVGLYYSPNQTRKPSLTSEGNQIDAYTALDNLDQLKEALGEYYQYLESFIFELVNKFEIGDDWGMYIPEVKYVSDEPLVNYDNLTLVDFPNVHFVGDSLSARGITVSGAQAIYAAEDILRKMQEE